VSRRQEQLAADLQRAVQDAITRGLHDPRVRGLITVTEVRVSQDLREATILVSVLPAEAQELTLHGLISAAPHLRHALGESVRARNIPNLHFRADTSTKKQAGVLRALEQVRDEREKRGEDANTSEPPGDEPPADSGDRPA